MIKGFLALAVASLVGVSAQADLSNYAGSYNGKFEGTVGSIHIGVVGQTLTAKFTGKPANGNDILGGTCGSSIGQMLELDMDGSEVDHATFAFDPGSCATQILGRELNIDFKHKDGIPTSLKASVYSHETTSWETVCTGGDPSGGIHCQQVPRTDYWYATGKFKK